MERKRLMLIGCMTPYEVHEVAEYSLAAIEHRRHQCRR
jgi:isopentenyl diphosphate isomerase/L-lactate dehydrogenase-like FMN-dependent dehydrogenase